MLAQIPQPGEATGQLQVQPIAPAQTVRGFSSDAGRWAWLGDRDGQSHLYVGGPAVPPQKIASSNDWVDTALIQDWVWVLTRSQSSGAGSLLRVLAGEHSGRPETVLTGLSKPGHLLAHEGALYWLELQSPLVPGFPFVPSVSSKLAIRVRDASGGVRTVGTWAASDVVHSPGGEADRDDLIGVDSGYVYLRVRRLLSTEFVRVRLEGGQAERIAGAHQSRQGILHRGLLHWVDESEEATTQAQVISIRRLEANGDSKTICDWVPQPGRLISLKEALYFFSDVAYRIPESLGMPVVVGQLRTDSVTTDGEGFVNLQGADAPRRYQPSRF